MTDPTSKPAAGAIPPLRPADRGARPERSASPAGAPPRLDRVPEGYEPPAQVRAATPPPRPAAAPAPAQPAARGGYGMRAREVGPEAAIGAGIRLSGRLEDASALRLFGLAAANGANGLLAVAPEGRVYTLVFRRGAVEHAASSDETEELGRFLLRRRVLTPEQLVLAESARAAAGGELASALVQAGIVAPSAAAAILQEHGAALIARALAAEAGSWSWEPNVSPPPGAFSLVPPFAALCAAVRALELGALKRRLGDRQERPISRVAGRVRLEDLRLTPQEARAAAGFDGVRTPAEIATAQPADAATVLRLALLLGDLDLAAFGPVRRSPAQQPPRAHPPPSAAPATAERTAAAPPAAAGSPPRAPRPATPPPAAPARDGARPSASAPPPGPARPADARAAPAPARPPAPSATPPHLEPGALEALAARLAGQDHFQVLGVKQDAPLAQLKVAYFQLAKLYHPDAIAFASPELRKRCADVFARVSEAWSVLSDDARRAAYLEQLRSGGTADVDVMRILKAESLFHDATLFVKARRYEDAKARLEEALALNPEEAEFGIWRAWCEFLVAPDKARQHAASAAAVEAGLKKNAKCAPGYLFLGLMAKITGDVAAAERQLKRGLAAMPDDADLVRELKYLKR